MSQDQASAARWRRYKQQTTKLSGLGITLDISKMDASNAFFKEMAGPMDQAFAAMAELEQGAIANPDENRMVGHYWLRAPHLAPNAELKGQIEKDLTDIQTFVRKVHKKELTPPGGSRFTELLIVGIGGSALGPQLMADALGKKNDKLKVHFFDNTDTDGMQRTIDRIGSKLKSTLVLVISKSGGTPETRNGMLEAKAAFENKGLDFAKHAVAVTGIDSKLDKVAASGGWLARFPMYDWVGGRTSLWSAVGILPMALQGIDAVKFLEGAAKMDALTRQDNVKKNPAAQLALMWHLATNGKGEKDMVILPYKDRLCLFSKYLQQLVMESLGKQLDLDGNEVHQGIAVYGNKGSTDQHAYVQQLRDGVNNFFATFIVVLQDTARPGRDPLVEVEEGITSGDYLHGFYQGTRQALYEAGRQSMTILCDKVDARTVGALTALYERAVGLYATLVNINAYHQPGVEAGKKAAAVVLDVQQKAVAYVTSKPGQALGVEEIAQAIGAEDYESVFMIMEHLAANKRISRQRGGYAAV